MSTVPSQYAYMTKALVAGFWAFIFAACAAVGAALSDGNISGGEALIAVGVAVTAFGVSAKATYEASNTPQV